LNIFRKYVKTILVWLKYDKNNDYFTRRPTFIYDNGILLRMRNVVGKICRENKTYIWHPIPFFYNSCCVWGNVEK